MDFNALSKRLIVIAMITFLSACAEDGGEKDSRVVISATDKITDLNILQYQLPLVVQVADVDGSPQANTEVKINLTTTSYQKGWYRHIDTSGEDVNGDGFLNTVNEDVNFNGILDSGEDINFNWILDIDEDFNNNTTLDGDGTTDEWHKVAHFSCPAEDVNNNVLLDAGEDINGNGLLEPETPTLSAHPSEIPTLIPGTSTLITDSNGFGYLTITYPKSEATWVSVTLTATTQGGLSENRDVYELVLPGSKADIEKDKNDPPAFVDSPYGYSPDCTSTI